MKPSLSGHGRCLEIAASLERASTSAILEAVVAGILNDSRWLTSHLDSERNAFLPPLETRVEPWAKELAEDLDVDQMVLRTALAALKERLRNGEPVGLAARALVDGLRRHVVLAASAAERLTAAGVPLAGHSRALKEPRLVANA